MIYSLDARGLVVGLPDAKQKYGDVSGAMARNYNSVFAQQDALNALASDTGGRFLKNTNALDTAITTALSEISRYYLMGWHVDPDTLQTHRYRTIQVSIPGHPDLKVRLRQGALDFSQLVLADTKGPQQASSEAGPSEGALKQAIESPFPVNGLPIVLHVGYFYQPDKGNVVALSYQIMPNAPNGMPGNGESKIEIMGMIANDKGSNVGSYNESLSCPPDPADPSKTRDCQFRNSKMIALPPGIYQARLAAQAPRGGQIGCVWEWIEVPPQAAGKLSMLIQCIRPTGQPRRNSLRR